MIEVRDTEIAARLIGSRAKRIEDPALLRGRGRYVDDIVLPNTLHAAFIRSSHAHALIGALDDSAARAVPGVDAVLTAASLAGVLTRARMPMGFPSKALPQDSGPNVLAVDEVCFVGEPIAIVLADSRHAAEDGANLVTVDYTPLPALVDCRDALDPHAPKVRRSLASNVVTHYHVAYGDSGSAFASAHHIARAKLFQHRGAAHSMEGRGILAHYEPATDFLTAWSSSQMAHDAKFMIADMLGMAESRVRVVVPDVGGGFGAKFLTYPEEVAIAAASRLMACPVKWIEDRMEHFLAAIQERDQHWDVEMALDADARIVGVRGRMIHDQGAYVVQGVNTAYNAATGVTGPYLVPHYDLEVFVVNTNKVYTTTVRGAGYPQGAFAMERLLDIAAFEMKLDRAEIRRRNLVPASKMPYTKPLKNRAGESIILDSGDYLAALEQVLARIDYAGFPARQAVARAAGRYIGIGFANTVKGTGRGPFESGAVSIAPSGRVTVTSGANPMGQGIATALAQVCADALAVPLERIDVVLADSATISLGVGGFASRQTITAGSSVQIAATEVRDKAIKVAAGMLEADPKDLTLRDGNVEVIGVPGHGIALAEIARALRGVPGYALPVGVSAVLEATVHWPATQMTYANAVQAAEVEVDIETGAVSILRYVALQDSGTLINPSIVEGQVHGGVVHGIGNALFEFMGYDDSGQPTTSTLADYLLPTATEVPNIEVLLKESPTPTNPLGVKGVGEGGTVPVAAVIASAVEDALRPFGVTITDVPISPVRLLALIDPLIVPAGTAR